MERQKGRENLVERDDGTLWLTGQEHPSILVQSKSVRLPVATSLLSLCSAQSQTCMPYSE